MRLASPQYPRYPAHWIPIFPTEQQRPEDREHVLLRMKERNIRAVDLIPFTEWRNGPGKVPPNNRWHIKIGDKGAVCGYGGQIITVHDWKMVPKDSLHIPIWQANGKMAARSRYQQYTPADPQTETPEFKAWFAGSQVTDKLDRPLVVYHGSPDARFLKEHGIFQTVHEQYGRPQATDAAFWFAADYGTANTYSKDKPAFDYQNSEPGVFAAYLSLKNPLRMNNSGGRWKHQTFDAVEQAKKEGHDGLIIENTVDDYSVKGKKATTTYAVFRSSQIKAISKNNGKFDPNEKSVFAAKTASVTPSRLANALRRGPVDPQGAHFSLPGMSTYHDEDATDIERYDLSGANIADTNDPKVTKAILEEALQDETLTMGETHRLRMMIQEADRGQPYVSYLENEELPLPDAAKRLGYDGILIWENDDITDPSTVFLWNVDTAKKTASKTAAQAKFLYHGTTRPRALNIAKQGLRGGQALDSQALQRIFLSDSEQYSQSYADRKGGSTGVVLRTPFPANAEEDQRTGGGDWTVPGPVAPEALEIKTPTGWIPLTEWRQQFDENGVPKTAAPEGFDINKVTIRAKGTQFDAYYQRKLIGRLILNSYRADDLAENERTIFNVHVDEPYRRSGVGTKLYDAAEAYCKEKGWALVPSGRSSMSALSEDGLAMWSKRRPGAVWDDARHWSKQYVGREFDLDGVHYKVLSVVGRFGKMLFLCENTGTGMNRPIRQDVIFPLLGEPDPKYKIAKLATPASPAFKSWFSGSKVVDKEGNPLQCYHGTKSSIDFEEFSVDGPPYLDDEESSSSSGSGADPTAFLGAHFAQETSVANQFAMGTGWQKSRFDGQNERPRVIPVFLSIKNPKVFSTEDALHEFICQGTIGGHAEELLYSAMQADGIDDPYADESDEVQEWNQSYDNDVEFRVNQNLYLLLNYSPVEGEDEMLVEAAADLARDARSRLQQQGFDGVRYKNKIEGGISWIVFSPEQVKSAFATGFDSKDQRFTASKLAIVGAQDGYVLRPYYRGSVPGSTERIRTGDDAWDACLFVADTPKQARNYGEHIDEYRFKPGARVLVQGSPEFRKIAGRPRNGESMVTFCSRVVTKAKAAGYDAVYFTLQGTIGTAIMNRDAIEKTGEYAESIPKRAQAYEPIPDTLYHGTVDEFDTFEEGHNNGWSNPRQGFYFTDDLEIAKEFGHRIVAAHLNMRNPLDLRDSLRAKNDFMKVVEALPEAQRLEITKSQYSDLAYGAVVHGMTQTPVFLAALKKVGFDSLILPDQLGGGPHFDSYIALSNDQIQIQDRNFKGEDSQAVAS